MMVLALAMAEKERGRNRRGVIIVIAGISVEVSARDKLLPTPYLPNTNLVLLVF